MIDDEEDLLELSAYWFRSRGHQVMTAINCETGINLLKTVAFDIVLLDMRMPNVDGVETLRRIRQMKKDLPVVLVTAYADDKMIKEAESLGISGVFRKGAGLHNLLLVIEVALKRGTTAAA